MDGARDAVVELRVELGQNIGIPDAGLGDITDGGSLHDVADHELLDRLVFGHATGTVGAAHGLHMATVVLVASSITALLGHLAGCFLLIRRCNPLISIINKHNPTDGRHNYLIYRIENPPSKIRVFTSGETCAKRELPARNFDVAGLIGVFHVVQH